ncbi:MAG TPA: hypothetical protein VFD36_29270 [Kofleriaceae bacterium]|nr:hypothetical protein [Kofleriaceae bacterium]
MSPRDPKDRDRDQRQPKTPPKGVQAQIAAPENWEGEEGTGNYNGEELNEIRRKRPTDLRFEILDNFRDETKHDIAELRTEIGVVKTEVGDLKGIVGKIEGQMQVWPKIAGQLESLLQQRGSDIHARLDIERDDHAFRREIIRTIVTKALIGIGAIWVVVSAILMAKYGLGGGK